MILGLDVLEEGFSTPVVVAAHARQTIKIIFKRSLRKEFKNPDVQDPARPDTGIFNLVRRSDRIFVI